MGVRKIAISVPEDVLSNVDKMAKKLKITRSRYITSLLENASKELESANITAQINQLFEDPAIQEEQKRVSDLFLTTDKKTQEGQEW